MYAVTGITGQVGGAAARALLEAGQPVRAVLRDPAKVGAWRDMGCEVALADLSDRAALADALRGVRGVFLLIPPLFDPTPGFGEIRALVTELRAAIEAAAPGRVVCLSTIGAQATEPNLLNQLGLVERMLETLPVPTTFLRAAWFMENASWDVADARAGRIRSFLQPLDRTVPMVATTDIGRLAADLLRQGGQGPRVVELEGPAPVSPNDVAAAFARALGHPVQAESVPRGEWEALFRAGGMRYPEPRARMLDGFNEGWIRFEGTPRRGTTTIDAVVAGLVASAR
jgi:NAD(P)H dehydrogenase (quinone)